MSTNKGLLVVVSGPSGAGKSTVLAHAFKTYCNLKFSVSVTTRAPREGEIDGVNYHFKSIEEYKQMLHNDEFLENQCVYGNYYGTPKADIAEKLENGFDVILEIDVKGALEIKNKFPQSIMVFLSPKDYSTIENRLRGRCTESEDQLQARLNCAMQEIKQINLYDYIVINEDATKGAKDIIAIIQAEKCTIKNNKEFIDKLIYGGYEL